MPPESLAALDLGSNTFRLILAGRDAGGIAPGTREVWQELPRISEGLVPGSDLAPGPKARAWAALEGFQAIIEERRPARVLAGATMAFRQAADGPRMLAEIARRFGWRTAILSGAEEARLSALGALSGLDPVPDEALIVDIGGRSTELINTRGRDIAHVQSLAVGVVGLTERHLASDPPTPDQTAAARREVTDLLARADWSALGRNPALVGTAGTVTTVAAMLLGLSVYDPARINNSSFPRAAVEGLLAKLQPMPASERAKLPGLHPRRADVIVAGLLEVAAIMDYLGLGLLAVSDNSLLEGLWLAAAGLAEPAPHQFTEVAP
jgi:exopolyphosphatase/guanosine-5'-triphosphate,3'-diphosphate pyrophosphatase